MKPPKKGRKWFHHPDLEQEVMTHEVPPGRIIGKLRGRSEEEKKQYSRDWSRNNHLKKKFNITSEEFDVLLEAQSNKCAICETTEPGGVGNFHVDHSHTSGKSEAFCVIAVIWQ